MPDYGGAEDSAFGGFEYFDDGAASGMVHASVVTAHDGPHLKLM